MFRSRHLALLIALLAIMIATPILAPMRHGLIGRVVGLHIVHGGERPKG